MTHKQHGLSSPISTSAVHNREGQWQRAASMIRLRTIYGDVHRSRDCTQIVADGSPRSQPSELERGWPEEQCDVAPIIGRAVTS